MEIASTNQVPNAMMEVYAASKKLATSELFQFLLIEWVLGTELLAKGSPRGTPTIPKVSL
jgi:hypothetical protein